MPSIFWRKVAMSRNSHKFITQFPERKIEDSELLRSVINDPNVQKSIDFQVYQNSIENESGLNDLKKAMSLLKNKDDLSTQIEGLIQLGKLMWVNNKLANNALDIMELIPVILGFLSPYFSDMIKYEASLIVFSLSNEANMIDLLIQNGVLLKVYPLIMSQKCALANTAIAIIANIAMEREALHEKMLNSGILHLIQVHLNLPNEMTSLISLKISLKCILQFINNDTNLEYFHFTCYNFALIFMRDLVLQDQDILYDICQLLNFYIRKQNFIAIQTLLNIGILYRFIDLLDFPHIKLELQSLVFISSITKGNHDQVNYLLSLIPCIKYGSKLYSYDIDIVKQVLYGLSNIVSGLKEHKDYLIKNENIMSKVVELATIGHNDKAGCNGRNREIMYEALSVLYHLTCTEEHEHFEKLEKFSILEVFFKHINVNKEEEDIKILDISMESIWNILDYINDCEEESRGREKIKKFIELDGVNLMEKLQGHSINEIKDSASRILEVFWKKSHKSNDPNGLKGWVNA